MEPSQNNPSASHVLAKAVARAASALGLTAKQLALTLGINESHLGDPIDPDSSEGARARQLVMIFKQLHALTGGDSDAIADWMKKRNRQFSSAPIDLTQTQQGLNDITAYLESLSR